MVKTVSAIRYITPLREGGSLPAIVEADDGEMYVVKFVGAGQGPKALIAELVAGEIGRDFLDGPLRTLPDGVGAAGIGRRERVESGLEPPRVERRDRKGSDAAFGAPAMAVSTRA